MPRMLSVLSSLLLTLVVTARADVAPYPAWRIVTNGSILGAAQRGGTIYFGGNFSKVGRGVPPFDGFLDLASLAVVPDPGCARDQGRVLGTAEDGASRLVWRDQLPFGSRLSDGAGPFVVSDEVRYVRVGGDCRFDRHFALSLPVQGGLWGSPVYVGDLLYSTVQVATQPPFGTWYVAAFDARTGDLLRGWPVPNLSSLVGIGAEGRLALTYPVAGALTLGFFDPTTGVLSAIDSLPGATFATVTPLGSRALLASSIVQNGQSTYRLDLYDLATWQRLPAWPEVRAISSIQSAASAGRLVVAGKGIRVGGGPSHALAAFDLQSGAPDQAWLAPAWLDVETGFIAQVSIVGSRLFISGDFVAGAPRDTIAALDLATGSLDTWEFPYATPWVTRAGSRLYLGNIASTRRVARQYMAAVDAVSGDLVSWDPGALLPAADRLPVTAFVRDGSFAYAAHPGMVGRYDLASGASDPGWRLDALTARNSPATVNHLAAGSGVIYATGDLDQARAGGVGPFEIRNGGAAVTMSGTLTSWNPRVSPTCSTGGRIPSFFPCIADVAVTPDRVFLRGSLTFLGTSPQYRSIAAVTTDTGALDPAIPSVYTSGFTAAEGVLYVSVTLDGRSRLVRVDPGLRMTMLPEPLEYGASRLAVRNGRVYVAAELDAATGAPTGNKKYWGHPLPADHGVLDVEYSLALALHADLTGVPPGQPSGLTASVSGDAVALRWTRAPSDLQPLVPAPVSGGTAATSHLITASLTPGGAAIAQLDTASADTVFTVTAPSGAYFVRVLAKNAFGFSEASNEVRIEVRPSAPAPPLATVATVIGSEVRVRWQAARDGWPTDGYVLEAGSRPGAADLAVIPVRGIEFKAFRVPAGRFYVRVRAVNAQGASEPGQEVVVQVGS